MVFVDLFLDRLALTHPPIRQSLAKRRRHHGQTRTIQSICYSLCITYIFFFRPGDYSLLGALKHWGLDASKIKVVNLQPAEIAAAWKRGDIDGAFVWSPALGEIRKTGKTLTDAAQVGQWGAPTFEVWVARKDYAEKHPEVVARFAKVTLDPSPTMPPIKTAGPPIQCRCRKSPN